MIKQKSGEHDCVMQGTLEDHEMRIRHNEKMLSEGDTRFVRLEGKLESVSEKLGELSYTIKAAVRWVLVSVGTLGIGAIAWAFIQSKGGIH